MKLNYSFLKGIVFFYFLIGLNIFSIAQTPEQVKQIIENYDLKKGEELYKQFKEREENEKQKAVTFAKRNNIPIFKENKSGGFDELMYLLPSGEPVYYSTDNAAAATSTRVNFLRSGGGLGLNLTGTGMVPRMWDGGPIHNHQEYAGRITMVDGTTRNTNSFHAIHVMGTIIASGVQTSAKGMAPTATARSFEWNNDESEAISEAMNGMLLSNHSYGVPVSSVSTTPWYIGAYSQESYNWDVITYNFPYYLPVMSAGNDGSNNNPSPTTTGYDKLNGNKTAKNILTVANATDATVNATTGAITAGGTINTSSSQGPADDRRIKPDITGNGTGLYSCGNGSGTGGTTTQYSSLTGTSMAAPNVTGTLTLVQQHYYNVNGSFMKAATLKGLACHTATDRGRTGPDAQYGWGYLDAKSCVEAITNNGLSSWISEETLSQGQTFTMQVVAQGGGVPLLGSITWTDVPDATKINNGVLNESTPDLTNDLDIRITQGANTYYPWRLQSSATANATRNSDNDVDNVERINIDTPTAGQVYTITVTHKGTLADGPQDFALVVTGVSSNFTFNTTTSNLTMCSNAGNAVYNFNFQKIGGSSVNLSASNVPTGAILNFSQTSINANGSFNITISNLTNVAAGSYTIDVTGNNGSESETRKIKLTVYHADFTSYPQTTNLPANGATGVSTSPTLSWGSNNNAESYNLEIATDPAFSSIVHSSSENGTSVQVNGLTDQTIYYWRVTPINRCATGNPSPTKAFQTGLLNCSYTYTNGTNVAINNTVDNSGLGMGVGWSVSQINVPTNFTVGNVNMDLLLQHTYIQDLTMYLESPNGTYIILAQEPCGDNDNIDAKFIDGGNTISCTAAVPALTGNVQPEQTMSTFQNLNSSGNWLLYVNDNYNGDNGTIDSWTLNLCSIAPITNVPNLINNGITTLTNSTYDLISSDILATTASETASQQVYTIVSTPTLGNLRLNNSSLNIGDSFTQADVDNGNLDYINSESSSNTTNFIVDVKNGANGWLGNQVINITILSCGDLTTNWNGSTWSNGTPSKIKAATFTGNYTSTGDLEACSINISNNSNITVSSGDTFIVNGEVVVNSGSTLTVENNAALRQIDGLAVNTGNIIVNRVSEPMIRLDYTAWSSPVSGQQLQAFSPNTVATRFYEYLYTGTTTPTAYQSVTSTNNFTAGKGYMIRVDNTWSSVSASAYNGQFTGVPFNGNINQSVGLGYNLLGNPYASPIDADTFLADNSTIGTLYFWTNTTPASGGSYPQNNFASYTTLGGAAAFASAKIPNGIIQTGQGFYVQASSGGTTNFNNAQRIDASASTQFFKLNNNSNKNVVEKHRIWLNLNDANTSYNQMLVGYMEGATNGIDNMIDGKIIDSSKPMLYNLLNNDAYVIQGKALPFSDDDVIALGLQVLDAGNYNINIEKVDGLFDNQDVFLKDNQTGITHDLKQGEYQFISIAGTFTNRFELVFKPNALSQELPISENVISVYSNSSGIQISSSEQLDSVLVFDILGRKLFEANQLNSNSLTINQILSSQQTLIVKVKDVNGNTISKKLVH